MERAAAFAIAACLLSGCFFMGKAGINKVEPYWSGTTIDGKTITSDSLRGKAVYLNFFGNFCVPCNEEAPSLNRLQMAYGKRGLQIIGIDIGEPISQVRSFARRNHTNYPIVADLDGSLGRMFMVHSYPQHVFIRRDGVVHLYDDGRLEYTAMEERIAPLLY